MRNILTGRFLLCIFMKMVVNSVYLPYLTVAAVYLMLVMTFTWLLGKLERHLRNTGADPVHNDS